MKTEQANMREANYETIAFCPEDYMTYDRQTGQREFDREAMWKDIGNLIKIMIRCKYQIKVWSDEYCVILEYSYQDPELREADLKWVSEDSDE